MCSFICNVGINNLPFVKESQGKCTNSRMSPSTNTQVSGESFEDRQFVVLASEKQARVVALPSQNCVYRQQLAETHIVIKAEVTSLKGIAVVYRQNSIVGICIPI